MLEPRPGRLLVAGLDLRDPNFSRTVVLLLEASADGALGVVLNRPSVTDVAEVLPDLVTAVAPPARVFVGGPVAVEGVLALGVTPGRQGSGPVRGTTDEVVTLVSGRIGVVDMSRGAEELVPATVGLRVVAGYSGWGAGQLAAEIDAGGWHVVEGRPEDVLDPDPEGLWRRVLRRQAAPLAYLSTLPEDPRTN